MASQRIDIWQENSPQQISVNSENTPKSIPVENSSITVLDNNYDNIANKPSINGVTLEGDKSSRQLGLNVETDRLNKEINNLENSLKPIAKSGDYDDLSDKPSINGVTLSGNKTSADLHIEGGEAKWGSITGNINTQSDLKNALDDKVPTYRTINNKALSQNITLTAEDIGVQNGYDASWCVFEESCEQSDYNDLLDALTNSTRIYINLDGYYMECASAVLGEGDNPTINLRFIDPSAEPHYGEDDTVYLMVIESTINGSTLTIQSSFPTFNPNDYAKKSSLKAVATSGDYDDLTDKPSITYTGTSIASRVVTQQTVTEPVSGTKPIGSYGPFNYIPLDLSSYTSGAANKALKPEDHLPDGFYVITAEGYARLGSDTKQLKAGTLLYWIENEVYLIGYNACEYWSYDPDNETWEGGYFTTQTDVDYMIQQAIGTSWTAVNSGAFAVANKENGYYIFNYSSASGTGRRISINVKGTTTYYFPYNGTILIKSDKYVVMLGRENLIFKYNGTNYDDPIDLTSIQSQLDSLDARITALGG